MAGSDVVVAGGGVIGLAIAWRCAQRGLSVTVLDPAPGSGASWTAAGMLAPVSELHYGEEDLLRLNIDSARRYPEFVAELESESGGTVGYRRTGTLVAAWDGGDLTALRDLHAFQRSLGLDAELVTGREMRRLEPALATGLPGGLLAADDHQVDNRLLHGALLVAARRAGAVIEQARLDGVDISSGRVQGAIFNDGSRISAGIVVIACGAWSAELPRLSAELVPPVRPVKGQTLRLRLAGEPIISRAVRGSIKGSPIYLVPRADGRIVVGASVEEAGFDVRPRTGVVYELLRDAQSLLPVLSEAEFEEVSTSVRPGTPDNAPIIGPTPVDGLIMATGHYRNGILLTPVTADLVAPLIVDGSTPELLKPFNFERFTKVNA